MLNGKYKCTHSELFFHHLIFNVQKEACAVSARISKALVILAGLSTSISSNSFNNLFSAQQRGQK